MTARGARRGGQTSGRRNRPVAVNSTGPVMFSASTSRRRAAWQFISSASGIGLPNVKPWPVWQPSFSRASRCDSISMPSATVSRPSASASDRIARASALASLTFSATSPLSCWMNERSILRTSSGKRRRQASEE